MPRIPVGLQLYTLRAECEEDFQGTVRAVAEMGYEGIELAGNGALSASEMRALVDECGIRVAGSHHPFEDLEGDLGPIVDYNKEIGNTRVVLPYLPREIQDKGKEGYLETARVMNDASRHLKEEGLSLSYHNHSFEFVRVDGEYLFDTLLGAIAEGGGLSELDTYWVQHGGADPVEYINKYSGRIDLLHIKDMAKDNRDKFAEIGSGVLDWDGIFSAAEKAGVAWYLVEQDVCPGPPLESVKKSLEYLRSRGMLG